MNVTPSVSAPEDESQPQQECPDLKKNYFLFDCEKYEEEECKCVDCEPVKFGSYIYQSSHHLIRCFAKDLSIISPYDKPIDKTLMEIRKLEETLKIMR
jgi:hypothetical protein